ncbi:MAG TPA: glycogen synthase GlgA [Verrucomicrobiae bacterium]|nr:glycogen synthase GlgA [Verrucomicrobiae bacterium]
MRILLASSEVHPYSKTGGLADMVGALGKHLARAGHQVGLVTPLYAGIREKFPAMARFGNPLQLMLGHQPTTAEIWALEPINGLTIYFVDQPDFYQRPALYQRDGADFPDNAERFIFFSKVVAHLALTLPWNPEVVHAHDWQAGLVPLLMQEEARLGKTGQGRVLPRTFFTIHNLAYQGLFPISRYALTNLSWSHFTAAGLEFYGQLSCLKAGIAYSDYVTTVSPRYSKEITTTEYGCGLDGFLQDHQAKLVGILNGVDYEEWNPETDNTIQAPYSAADLNGKAANKAALQEEMKLPVDANVPLLGSINRLVEQKGVDIQLGALEEMLGADLQFVLLGSGNPTFEQAYVDLAKRHPTKVAVQIGYNHGLSHRIEAGTDFFLLPSRFEPCGLNQMYSLRYGSVPIVRATGGLDDTVIDFSESPESANGIKFSEYSSTALARAIRKGLAIYDEPELLEHYRMNGMAADFSWSRTADQYLSLYRKAP